MRYALGSRRVIPYRSPVRTLLIHNPKAGYEQANADEILRMLGEAGHETTYQSSEIDDLSARMNEPWDLLVVAGGDGTVTRSLKVAAERGIPVAILPLGTANNVATALGHTGALQDLIHAWDPASRRPVDLGLASGDWGHSRFAESFGVGLMAETIVAADKGDADKARTKHRTVADRLDAITKAVHKRLGDLKPARITLRTPDQEFAGEFLWAEVSTVGLVGPRLPILESDDPGDGLLAFALLPPEERDTFDQYLEHRQSGSAPRRTGLVTGRAPKLTIEWSRFAVHLDGKLLPTPPAGAAPIRSAELEIQPGAAQVLRLRR